MKRIILLLNIIVLFYFSKSNAQLTTLGSTDATALAAELAGPGVTVFNATLNCPGTDQRGFFDGGSSIISIANGIVLTSGDINVPVTVPNDSTNSGLNQGGDGDADLDSLIGDVTFDACILEFDFIPIADTVTFKYVFGSE